MDINVQINLFQIDFQKDIFIEFTIHTVSMCAAYIAALKGWQHCSFIYQWEFYKDCVLEPANRIIILLQFSYFVKL